MSIYHGLVERNVPPYQSARSDAVFDLGKTCLWTTVVES